VTKFAAGPPGLVTDQVAEIGLPALSLFAAGDRGGDGRTRSPVCPRHPQTGPWLPRSANPATTGRTAPTVARQPASLVALSPSA